MSSISFTAHGRCARATVCEPITTGSVGLSVSFAFDAAWSGLQKTAIFRGSGMAVDLVLNGDAATVPPEVLTIPGGDLRIGVWGADPDENVIIPTVWATVGEIVPGSAPSGIDPQPPTPSWAAQVQEIAQDALDTANSVREDADAGAFDGATYTPAVSAGGDLSWTNDKGKPNPPTVNIKGPAGQPGQTGATPDISIGTVETLPPGSPATATITGTAENPVLSFGIPQGQQGAPGEVTQAEFDDLADEVTRQKSALDAHEQYAEETYAKQDGSYEDLTAGNAYELLSDRGDTNQQPYLFRQTGGDSSAYNREQLRKIVGGTVAWNQLKENGDFETTVAYYTRRGTFSVSDNIGTVIPDGTVTSGTLYYGLDGIGSVPITDGHKYCYFCDIMSTQTDRFRGRMGNVLFWTGNIPANTWGTIAAVFSGNGSSTQTLYAEKISYTTSDALKFRNFHIHDLTQMFGTAIADYIYSLEQANAGAGVAFFRSLFPDDYYDYNSGELMSVEGVSAHIMRDADNNIVKNYPLDSSLTLRGIPKLDSNNRLYYDGDTYEPDGTVTRKYGIVDLGTLNFGATSAYGSVFRAGAPLPAAITDNPSVGRLVDCRCVELEHSLYVADSADRAVANTYGIRYNNIYVCFSESKTRAEVLAALSGILLVYPLLTPTTETAEPYRELEICDRDGTEEFVSTSIVPVGHETFYPVNVFDYIDRLTEPDADMIADSAIAANKYFSVGNRLFLSIASIAAGAMIIPGTNCQETSLAAALNALNA